LIVEVTERHFNIQSAFKNQQPSGANRNEVKMANGKQPAAGSPEGEAGGPRQSSIGNQTA
jgi:hypothetical protein